MRNDPKKQLYLADFPISLTQPLDFGACRLFIAAASIAVYELRQLVTEFIGQLVAAGEIMQGAGARPKWDQESPDALSQHGQ